MRHIVLFQHNCAACSKVARMVRDLAITGLEARALEDPQVTALLSNAQLPTPDRPSLLIVNDDDVQLLTGWAMRRRLAGVIGWRRSAAIVSLLAAEWGARLTQSAESHEPSRRGVIGGALAGLGGWILMSGSAAASPRKGPKPDKARLATPAETEMALATGPVRTAIRTWGPVEGQVFHISGPGAPAVLALPHPRSGVLTLVEASPHALRGGQPTALSQGHAPAGHQTRYHSVAGAAILDLGVHDGKVRGRVVQPGPGEAEPDVNFKLFSICLLDCIMGKGLTPQCVDTCYTCGNALVTRDWPSVLNSCPTCATCGGRFAVQCAKDCAASS
jgi:hypothetical protein